MHEDEKKPPVGGVVIRADAGQLLADLLLLAEAAEFSGQVRQRLLDAGDLTAQVRCVNAGGSCAMPAGEVGVRLEFADGLAHLAGAVRAGELDAVAAIGCQGNQTHFLHQPCAYTGNVLPGADIGHKAADHRVVVFDNKNGIDGHPVVFRIDHHGFSLQEYLTADEARTLAQALLLAAEFSERTSLDRAVDVAMAAAEVAA